MASISVLAVGDPITAGGFLDPVANWINGRTPALGTSSAAGTQTSGTELKDTGIGDVTLTVSDATVWYELTYNPNMVSSNANNRADVKIRDGGASSPTNASTLLAWSTGTNPGAGANFAVTVTALAVVQFTVGTHVLAPFYAMGNGTGGCNPQALARFLSIVPIS